MSPLNKRMFAGGIDANIDPSAAAFSTYSKMLAGTSTSDANPGDFESKVNTTIHPLNWIGSKQNRAKNGNFARFVRRTSFGTYLNATMITTKKKFVSSSKKLRSIRRNENTRRISPRKRIEKPSQRRIRRIARRRRRRRNPKARRRRANWRKLNYAKLSSECLDRLDIILFKHRIK